MTYKIKCSWCGELSIPRTTNSRFCSNKCMGSYNGSKSKNNVEKDLTVRQASDLMDEIIANETLMPWEKKKKRSV